MLVTFETILPIFLLIMLGLALRQWKAIPHATWQGLEQISYWILYPTLLLVTILHADFSTLRLDTMMAALLVALAIMTVIVLACWPVLNRLRIMSRGEYSSTFQTALRWNGFVALAVAQKLFPPEASAVVALVMAVIIIPLNVMAITVVSHFGTATPDWRRVAVATATNPFIIFVAAGMLLRLLPNGLWDPIDQFAVLIGQAAIGMGLIVLGAGLRPSDIFRARIALWIPVALRLILFPLVMIATGHWFGIGAPQLAYLALCTAVPTAMNGYMLARQLGGDAEFYAAVTTVQTVVAFVTMPMMIALALYVGSG